MLPPRAGCFQDRAAASALRQAVAGGGTAVVCQVLAGMGGVGKTQLAADHARHAWSHEEVDLLVWVTAATHQAVIDAYAEAAVDVLCADPADPEGAARAFLAWLEPKLSPQAPRWLIVLDDVADPGDLTGLWPPAHAHGRTLVTTRRRDAALASHGRLVPVGLFTRAEATAYLQQALAAHGRHEPAADLTALSDDLGYLPLALSQAAAYLIDTHLDTVTYRTRLADRARQLSGLLPEPGTPLPDDQSTTVTAAWSLSLDRADQLRPAGLARPMLQLAAMLDPNGIPHQVLTSNPALAHLTARRTEPDAHVQESPAVTAEDAAGALGALHRLSLIDYTPDTPHQAVRVHQLIQRAMRDPLAPDEYDHVARTAADALVAAWPGVEFDIPLAQALRANTETLAHHAKDALYEPGIHHVLFRTGNSLGKMGQASAAMNHFAHLTELALHRLGPDHPDTLTARNNLSAWVGYAGDASEAVSLFAALVTDQERVRGPKHPETLITRNNLVHWRGQAGDAIGAAAAAAELLPFQQQILGPDHPDTLTTRNNLAAALGYTGDAAGAAAAFAELIPLREQVLGPAHPDTLTTRHNLAHWQGTAGDAAGAAAALTELLPLRKLVLGPDHPDTLTTRFDIATWQIRAGDAAGAIGFVELLPDMTRVMGPNHPHTVAVRQSALGGWLGEAGEATETAAEIYAFVLAELFAHRERQLGQEHPDSPAPRRPDRLNNLASQPSRARWGAGSLSRSLRRYLPRGNGNDRS
ncbi:tetratricopeptide repeat protein [Streptomyces sp. ISL-94]|uniref:tetratricopeptide repeat protein n=1 Tax=Streptomyces sp. ISL-94 TaxID=2819190 RepID=UPI001BECA0E1|nr:tetratricopeptide repeat protein [Streptomyces sp. ISL-94]MBT2482998.1 tetratricopeptide repeat protein [Streptomyces sp. ISL-94]